MNKRTYDLVVLIPGLLCDTATFQHQIKQFTALNIPHYVPSVTQHNNITMMANQIIKDATSIISPSTTVPRLAISGFSYGGYLALEIARLQPSILSHFSMICSQAREDSSSHTERRLQQIKLVETTGNLSQVMIQQCKLLLHPSQLPSNYEDMINQYFLRPEDTFPFTLDSSYLPFRTFVEMGHRVGNQGFITQQQSIMGRKNNLPLIETLSTLPTMESISFIRGANDVLIPRKIHTDLVNICITSQEKLTTNSKNKASNETVKLPKIYETEINTCGHMAPIEKPDEVTEALLQWLNYNEK